MHKNVCTAERTIRTAISKEILLQYTLHMYKETRYAVDALVIFILFVSITIFLLNLRLPVDNAVVYSIQGIDFMLVAASYIFFGHDLYKNKRKLEYCKKHWMFIFFIFVPLLPIVRIIRFSQMEWAFKIFTGTLSQFLERLELL